MIDLQLLYSIRDNLKPSKERTRLSSIIQTYIILVERDTVQTPKYKRTSIDTVIINCTACNYHLNTSLINERYYMKFCPRCGQRIAGDDND